MKKLTVIAAALSLFLAAFGVFAADPWQSKPYTEWSDKEVQKILTNSPWARPVTVGNSVPRADSSTDTRGAMAANASANPSTGPGPDGQDGGSGNRNRIGDMIPSGTETRSFTLTILWQSALPVKQALVRRRFGAEGASSADAKKVLDENASYLISVSGLTPEFVRAAQSKSEILQRTVLAAKGKEPVHPTEILVSPSGKVTEAVFVFPKTTPFTLEDKDVEFSTELGGMAVKNKFHLKDMLVGGTLQL